MGATDFYNPNSPEYREWQRSVAEDGDTRDYPTWLNDHFSEKPSAALERDWYFRPDNSYETNYNSFAWDSPDNNFFKEYERRVEHHNEKRTYSQWLNDHFTDPRNKEQAERLGWVDPYSQERSTAQASQNMTDPEFEEYMDWLLQVARGEISPDTPAPGSSGSSDGYVAGGGSKGVNTSYSLPTLSEPQRVEAQAVIAQLADAPPEVQATLMESFVASLPPEIRPQAVQEFLADAPADAQATMMQSYLASAPPEAQAQAIKSWSIAGVDPVAWQSIGEWSNVDFDGVNADDLADAILEYGGIQNIRSEGIENVSDEWMRGISDVGARRLANVETQREAIRSAEDQALSQLRRDRVRNGYVGDSSSDVGNMARTLSEFRNQAALNEGMALLQNSQDLAQGRLGVEQMRADGNLMNEELARAAGIDAATVGLETEQWNRIQEQANAFRNAENEMQQRIAESEGTLRADSTNTANNLSTQQFNATQGQRADEVNAENQRLIDFFNIANLIQNNQFNAGQQQDTSRWNAENQRLIDFFNIGNDIQNNQFNAAQRQDASRLNAANQLTADVNNANNVLATNQFNAGQQQDASRFNAENQRLIDFFNIGNDMQNNQFNAAQQQDASRLNVANQLTADVNNANNVLATNQFNAGQQQDASRWNADNQRMVDFFNADKIFNTNTFNAGQRQDAQRTNAGNRLAADQFNSSMMQDRDKYNSNMIYGDVQYRNTLAENALTRSAQSARDAESIRRWNLEWERKKMLDQDDAWRQYFDMEDRAVGGG